MTNSLNRKNFITLLAILIIMTGFALPPIGGLNADAISLIGIFCASLLLWIFVGIDWPSFITLMALGLIPSLGFKQVFKDAFGNTTVAFLLFTFALVYPLAKTNFVKRCTIFFITNRFARKGPWHFVIFLFAAVTFMGLFISPSVLFVAFLPFLENILEVLELKKGGKSANMLMCGSAICINLSSGMTAIGHVWPTLAIGYYQSATGMSINQFQYMAFGIPTGLILITLLLLAFRFIYRPDDLADINIEKALSLKENMPAIDRKEKVILATVGLVVFLWVAPGLLEKVWPSFYKLINSYTSAFPPLLGCIILYIINIDGKSILDFKEVSQKGIMWGSIIMTASATALGAGITNNNIGISTWLSDTLGPFAQSLPVLMMIFFFMVWALIETNFSSNIVTTTVVSSVALTILMTLPSGTVSIGAVIAMVGFAAAVCNMTPAGQSTVNTVAIASGYTDAKSMFVWGLFVAVAAAFVLTFVAYPLVASLIGF